MNETGKYFCRFEVSGTFYSGMVRGSMVDMVQGTPWGEMSGLHMSYPLQKVRLLTPFDPQTIYCIGRNYLGHVKELNNDIPPEPLVFIKSKSAVQSTDAPIVIPGWTGRVDYEGELAVVIGKKCRNVKEEDAADCIMGYTCFNDVTARDMQKKDGQWSRCKSFDTFAPLGPYLYLSKILPQTTVIRTLLNGKEVQKGALSQMIFPIPRLIAHISRFATLYPGDVISTGTPEGVGPLAPGDKIEVDIENVGLLSNHCIPEAWAR